MNTLTYAPWRWLVAIPGLLLGIALAGAACLLLLSFLPARRVNTLVPVWWARLSLALIPARVRVCGQEHLEPGQSYVVVANHLSHVDIYVLYGKLGMDLRWVMKQELRRVPVIGICSAGLGHVFVDRENRHAALAALQEARTRLASDGASVIFFPEGTRSRDGLLHDFKKGAFMMAKDMNLPILPVTLRGTDAVLPPHSRDLLPGQIDVVIHRPVSAARVQSLTADELLRDTRAIIASVLPADRVA